jgi:hypothetical protein
MGSKKRQTTFAKRDRERQRMEKAALKRERRQARVHALVVDACAEAPPSRLLPASEIRELTP